MEPAGSLPHSQVPATCPYPEPEKNMLKRRNSASTGQCLVARTSEHVRETLVPTNADNFLNG